MCRQLLFADSISVNFTDSNCFCNLEKQYGYVVKVFDFLCQSKIARKLKSQLVIARNFQMVRLLQQSAELWVWAQPPPWSWRGLGHGNLGHTLSRKGPQRHGVQTPQQIQESLCTVQDVTWPAYNSLIASQSPNSLTWWRGLADLPQPVLCQSLQFGFIYSFLYNLFSSNIYRVLTAFQALFWEFNSK